MENLLSLIQSRQSERAYDSNRLVEQEKLDYIMEAVHMAPSACNAQPWKFIVVTDPEIQKQTASAIANMILGINHYAFEAPVHIIIVEEKANLTSRIGGTIKQKHFPYIDLGIAAAHIILAAKEQGLGSCIVGYFNEQKIKKILQIPNSKKVLLAITIGYSTQNLRKKTRKPFREVVSYNSYK
jgi:nitroreductase